jgi:hypothetical protein
MAKIGFPFSVPILYNLHTLYVFVLLLNFIILYYRLGRLLLLYEILVTIVFNYSWNYVVGLVTTLGGY